MDFLRKIIHIDMDAFYASVEQRDNPDLRGKPIAVGGDSNRGVVMTASYEARKYGVRSAMPSITAARLCKDLIFVLPHFDIYKAVSNQIRNIFLEYTDLVEPLSLDEAYLDVTSNKKNKPSATLIAKEIKSKIQTETQLIASAGISINKFLAKIASDMDKPDGLFLIPPDDAMAFVEKLQIEKFFGIGKVTAKKMHELGIKNGYDLKQWSESDLVTKFGKVGHFYYEISRARDDRLVEPNRIRKSLGVENTFSEDLRELDDVKWEINKILETLLTRMDRSNTSGKTLTIKIKYSDFQQITRSKTVEFWISEREHIIELISQILPGIQIRNGIRLVGLSLSNLNHEVKEEQEDRNSQLTFSF